MSKTKMVIAGLGCICIFFAAAAGFAFYQQGQLRDEIATRNSELFKSQEQIRLLEKQLKDAKDLATKALADLDNAKKELDQAIATAHNEPQAVGAAPAPAAAPATIETPSGKVSLKDMLQGKSGDMIARNAVGMVYGDLFKEMALDPQEREQFLQILIDGQINAQHAIANQKTGTAPDAAQLKDIQTVTQAKVKALLGDDRFKQYEAYQKEAPDRMQIKQFEGSLAMSANPLQDDQKKQMIQVMSEERQKITTEMKGSSPTDIQTQLNQRVANRLGTVLSPEQLTEFAKWQDSMVQMMRNFRPTAATAAANQ